MPAPSSPWDDPLDPAVVTTDAVANQRQPVLRVVHEEGHGGWQFYDDAEPLQGPVVLLKEEVLALDPSLAEITDLPVGWEAVRASPSERWHRTNC